MNKTPLVSICIPTYNSSRYLRQCLDSIVNQTYQNVEVIVCDNASVDDSVALANEYAKRYGFKVFINEQNIGAANNWNRLIDLAHGDCIAIYHSDDIYEPTIVEEEVQALSNNENVAIACTMSNVIDGEGKFLYEYKMPTSIKRLNKTVFCFDEVMLGTLMSGGDRVFFITPSLMVKRSAYEEVGRFNEMQRSAGDYAMWFKIATKYDVAVLDRKLINYRVHENQGSELELRKNTDIPDIVPIFDKYSKYITSTKIKKLNEKVIDKRIFITAMKQNGKRQFTRSSEMVKMMKTENYTTIKILLRMANRLHLKLGL